MNNLNKFLLMLIAMVTIMLIAVGIDKGYDYYQDLKWEKERAAVYAQAKAEVENMQATIETLSQNPDELLAYIEENELNYVEVKTVEPEADFGVDNSNSTSMSAGSVTGNSVSENQTYESSVSVNSVSENQVYESSVSENSVSENQAYEGSVTGNSVSSNKVENKVICASYEDTIRINAADKKVIAGNTVDFSDMKIACIGDSITAGTNLMNKEGYETMTYPYFLSQLLGVKEVVNLGIGGSSIGRYWDQAFVDRYKEVPKDTDLIIVLGGANDGFCATEKELGSLDVREKRTFVGDLDELLRGLKEDYPDAKIILVSPLSNVLHDMLRKTNKELLPQSVFADVMEQLANEHDINYIDIYHANFLDTHDAAVIHNFMPDGVHGNAAGYKILAEHLAAEVIQIYTEEQSEISIEE